jgi:CHASE3 domain sensor protein/anti-sigma regulatory factor (Ser/Thr protein kinase)
VTGGAIARPRTARWPRQSMAARLWGGLALFALLLLAAAGFVHSGVAQQDSSVDGLVQRLHPLQVANLEVRADFAQAQSVLRAYLLTREPRFLTQYHLDQAALARALGQARKLAARGELPGVRAEARAALAWLGFAGLMQAERAGSPALVRLIDQGSVSARSFYRASDRLQARLQVESRAADVAGARAVDHAVTVPSVFATIAALLGLAAALVITYGITGPLRRLVAILRRLTAGDHAARARVTGPAEMREVARSLNALADESERLRAQEAECSRLRATARDTALRVREHLRVEDLLGAAKDAIESSFGADVAHLHLKRDGQLGLPVGHGDDWLLPDSFLAVLRDEADALFRDLFQRSGSLVYQDIPVPTVTGYRRASGIRCARRGSSRWCSSPSGRAQRCWASSWLESGAFTTVMRPVDLADVVRAAADAVRPSVIAGELALAVDGTGGGLMVDGDASQLDRVVINLLSNAVKFTPKGGCIELSAFAEGKSAVIRVRDTGIGIPASDQKELFNRFFRASYATGRSIPGTGLGLAIVRMIVVNHGGDVELQSTEGAGTTVTVWLPLLPGEAG